MKVEYNKWRGEGKRDIANPLGYYHILTDNTALHYSCEKGVSFCDCNLIDKIL